MTNTKVIHTPYIKFAIWTLTGIAIFVGALLINQPQSVAADGIVYKSPTCGCCADWITHMEKNGFKLEVHDQPDMWPIKKKMGVPSNLQSCHTAMVGGYVIEGHVPADVIARLLKEKPVIKGLAVPGMPMGSPGMEGPRKDPYDVVTFDKDGKTTIYTSR